MDNLNQELYKECYAVAQDTMFEMRPIDVKEIEYLAMMFYEVAIEYLEQACDPALLIRAVSYLRHTHALPSSRRDTTWFQQQLSALIELACPNVIQNKESARFFNDIIEGIRISRKEMDKGQGDIYE